jgi:hypothetical protein
MKEKRIHVGRRAAWTALCFVLAAAWVLLPPAASAKTAGMREAGEAAVQITENGTVKTGLAVYGDDVQGNCGLSRNIYFLTQDQLEDIKDKQSADGYGLGSDAYLRDQVYSSYEHHGEGAYHYTRASGLSIPAMLQALTGSHYGNVKYFFIKARDGYNSTQAVNSINELQYFAPGDAAGVPSAAPMIALYKSTNEYVNRADGVVPDSAARLEPGREVLAFGQEEVNTPNNCQFVKGVDQVAAVREFGVLPESMTSSSTKGMLRIDAMLHGTIRDRSYTYGSGGSAVTYRVRGLSLDDAAAEMGLGELLADRADYRLRLTGADGKTVLVPQNRLSQATLAWDSDTAPAGQTGYYAAYLADGTADTAVLANVTAIDVVSASGQTVTSRVTAPKAPTGLRLTYASAASLRLTWKKVSDASGYRVYRSTGSHGSWTLRKTCSGRTAAFTDSGLTPGRLYRYPRCRQPYCVWGQL